MAAITHAAERKAFEVALNSAMKKVDKNRSEGYVEVVNMIEKVLKDGWKPVADKLWSSNHPGYQK